MTARRKIVNDWDALLVLISEYGDACRADEMKGGGDPDYVEVAAAQLALARAKVVAQVARMRREYVS